MVAPLTENASTSSDAALQVRTDGDPVDAMTLIPHMAEAFVARDRGFRRGKEEGSRVSSHAGLPNG